MNRIFYIFHELTLFVFIVSYFPTKTDCFIPIFHNLGNNTNHLNYNLKFYPTSHNSSTYTRPFSLNSRRSIETVIHTGDYKFYDPNCIKYRKAKYWREKSDEELQEEIRKIRKVLRRIEECIKVKDPTLLPDSKKNAKRTQAQLLFLLHERHLNSLKNAQNKDKKSNIAK